MSSIQTVLVDTVAKLLTVSDSPALDAEVLLCHAINQPRTHLRAWPDKLLSNDQLAWYQNLIQQRELGVPVAYLTGQKEFWSRQFQVNPDVLIPRPDTELLIEICLDLIHKHALTSAIDLGTGSGIIAITLAAECPQISMTATDFSASALAMAQQNAQHNDVHTIQFMESNWLTEIAPKKFDLVISNPPYIAEDDQHLQQGDVRFEPKTALIAGQQGLSDITAIADQARQCLNSTGHLVIEHGYNQQQPVQAIFQQFGYVNVITYPDLAGHPRVTYGQWPG